MPEDIKDLYIKNACMLILYKDTPKYIRRYLKKHPCHTAVKKIEYIRVDNFKTETVFPIVEPHLKQYDYVVVITDNVRLLHAPIRLPFIQHETVDKVICLHGHYNKIIQAVNRYWNHVSMDSSDCFIIPKGAQFDFTDCYLITQHYYAAEHTPNDLVLKQISPLCNRTPISKLVRNHLPNLSLVINVESIQTVCDTFISILKSNYPLNKLELILVDDQGLEMRLKSLAHTTSFVKIVNVPVQYDESRNIKHSPLGFKLNLGLEHMDPEHDMIMILKDSTVYDPDMFFQYVSMLMTHENVHGIFSKENTIYDCIFYKSALWSSWKFRDPLDDVQELFKEFVYYRQTLINII